MYRIKLTSGEEAVYRTLEELSLAVHSRVVGPDAQIYHQKSRQWLPINVHPDYKAALNKQPPQRRPSTELEAVPDSPAAESPLSATPAADSPIPVLQPVARRRREPQSSAVVLGGAAAVLVLALGAFFGWRLWAGGGNAQPAVTASPGAPAATGPAAQPETPSPSIPAPARADTGSRPATGPQPQPPESSGATVAASPAAVAPAIKAPSPAELSTRYAAAYQAARAELEAGTARLRLTRIFASTRLASADSVRTTRRALAAAGDLIGAYRARSARIERSYQDTVQAFIQDKGWATDQVNAWQTRTSLRETPEQAAAADSLLSGLHAVFALLLEQEAQYEVSESTISFNDPESADRFARLDDVLGAEIAGAGEMTAIPSAAPLAAILGTIGATRLPEILPKAPSLPRPDLPAPKPDSGR